MADNTGTLQPPVPPPSFVPIVCPGHSRPLQELHYRDTSDGLFLISACLDKMPMLRNGNTGDWIGTFAGHNGAVWSAKLNTPATRACTGSADFTVKIWNAITGKEIQTFDHKHIVKTVDFSSDGARLASGGQEKLLRIFDLNNYDAEPVVAPHPGTVRKAVWTADGQRVISGCADGFVRVWDARTLEEVRKCDVGGEVSDLEISTDLNMITVVSGKGNVQFLNLDSGNVEKSYNMEKFGIQSASLHKNGKKFIAGGSDMWVRLFDFENGNELDCNKGHHGAVNCVRFSPLYNSYSSGAFDATIRIWRSDKLN
eukprot:g358.t1